MKVFSTIVLFLCLCKASTGTISAKDWRGIIPLRSTRDDVVRLLGLSSDTNEIRSRYSLEKEDVYIVFSTKDDRYNECVKQLPAGTVMHIDITPKAEQQLGELHIDEKRFRKFDPSSPPDLGYMGYVDEEQGIIIDTYKGRVEEILYIASAEDKHLCSSYYEKPEMFIQRFVDFAPSPTKFDEYGDISFEDEKARLDAYAIQLGTQPGAAAYIMVYATPSARASEAIQRGKQAKSYLEKVRRIIPDRVIVVNGGYRKIKSVELWLVPTGAIPPTPTPTIKH